MTFVTQKEYDAHDCHASPNDGCMCDGAIIVDKMTHEQFAALSLLDMADALAAQARHLQELTDAVCNI